MMMNIVHLRQGIALLQDLDDQLFAVSPPGLEAGGIGPQFRHVIDYYECFLRDHASGRVDYDLRERDVAIEEQRPVAIRRLLTLVEQLDELDLGGAARPLRVKADAPPGTPDDEAWSTSSVRRELQFLTSHTVHHYALIAVTLAGHGVGVPSDFGVAPSTLQHWKSTAELAG